MSTKAKWKESFQKARSFSQTSSTSVTRKTSLLEEGDLSFSDDELEQYLGTIKKKSGLNRLWTGNTFDRVIDRTPDVSISSVSDGEVPIDEEDKNANSDNDFLPNILALPSVATEEKNSEISEPSSIKPFQAVNLLSDLSDARPEAAENVNVLSGQESKVTLDDDIKTASHNQSAEEVPTLDEISEEIEEDLSQGSKQNTNYSSKKDKSHRPKDSMRSEQSNETDHTCRNSSHRYSLSNRRSKSRNDSRHSRSGSKSKHSSQYTSEHSSLNDTSRKQKKTHSRHSKAESSKHSQKASKKSEDSYTTDFSECSRQTEPESSKKSSLDTRSAVPSTKVKSIAEMSKKTSKHKMNQCYHDVATQVNMDDVSGQKLGVGMATLGPSFGHRYVDPSPIARHVVNADAVEAVTAYNPAVVALTDMLRQQLRLVEQFVDNSRRMYESYTNNLNTTYRYTTLEDTLQYIDENGNRQHSSREPVTK
ncbi:Hypothetical predicted protein [Paramuricea clavata]|uniref:DUF4614 domain-containing protein n=1 Tax=Paramuricea clavata TaxID=317549 RepID=A0A6S7FW30_PARCT|nr:Hypothetical predicted protein [Paramuricea clavata]